MTELSRVEECPKCSSHNFLTEYEEDDRSTSLVCVSCGTRIEISRVNPKSLEVPIEEKGPIQRKIPGLSRAELQRRYRDSPVGKKAWERYRYSELFYQAHARHRLTQTYKETQERFKQKRKLFKVLLEPILEFTCPLKLFYKGPNGEIYHNQEKCDFDNEDCSLNCISSNGEFND